MDEQHTAHAVELTRGFQGDLGYRLGGTILFWGLFVAILLALDPGLVTG